MAQRNNGAAEQLGDMNQARGSPQRPNQQQRSPINGFPHGQPPHFQGAERGSNDPAKNKTMSPQIDMRTVNAGMRSPSPTMDAPREQQIPGMGTNVNMANYQMNPGYCLPPTPMPFNQENGFNPNMQQPPVPQRVPQNSYNYVQPHIFNADTYVAPPSPPPRNLTPNSMHGSPQYTFPPSPDMYSIQDIYSDYDRDDISASVADPHRSRKNGFGKFSFPPVIPCPIGDECYDVPPTENSVSRFYCSLLIILEVVNWVFALKGVRMGILDFAYIPQVSIILFCCIISFGTRSKMTWKIWGTVCPVLSLLHLVVIIMIAVIQRDDVGARLSILLHLGTMLWAIGAHFIAEEVIRRNDNYMRKMASYTSKQPPPQLNMRRNY